MFLTNLGEYLDVSVSGLKRIGNPLKTMKEMYSLMGELIDFYKPDVRCCEGENVEMAKQRWQRLRSNFYDPEKGVFDTTKIPDVRNVPTFLNSLQDF